MKLRLNKALLAAVLACFTIGATGAYATTLENATMSIASFTQDNLSALTSAGWALNNITASNDGVFTSTATAATIAPGTSGSSLTTTSGGSNDRHIWSAIVTVKVDSLTNNAVELLNGAAGDSSKIGLAASSSSVTGTWEGSTSSSRSSMPYTYNNGNGTVTFGIVYEGDNGTTLYVGSEKVNDNGLKYRNSPATKIKLAGTAGIQYTNLYWFNNAVTSADMQSMLGSFEPHTVLTWGGTADNSTWDASSENWNNSTTLVSFGTYKAPNVIFSNAADVSKTVNVSGEQKAFTMTLQDSYTFNLQEGASVTADSIHIDAAGKTLSLTGNGTVRTHLLTMDSSSAISMADNAHLEFDATLTMDSSSAISMADNAHLEVGGALTLNSSSAISMAGTASVTAANITLKNGTANTLGNIVMRGNTTLVANGNSTLSVQKFSVSTEADNNQTLILQGTGTLTINGESELKNVHLQGADLVINANTTMDELSSQNGSANSDITVEAGTTLNTTNIANRWGINTMTVNGVLNTGDFLISTGDTVNTINGTGVINADSLEVTNQTTKAAFSGVTLNLGSSGITQNTTSFQPKPIEFGDMTVGVREGADGWSTSLNTINLAGTGTGTKFAPGADKSITISGNMSGTGKLVKTGAGTLTLSGANTYAGGTTVEDGTLIVNGTGSLSTGDVTVTGGSLTLNAACTSTAALTVSGGSATLEGNGSWAGAIEVGSAGTLAFNGAAKEIAADKNITFANGATLAVTGGSLTISKALSVTKFDLSGAATLNANLTVTGSTTLATTSSSIAISNEKIFSTDGGVLTVTGTGNKTAITTSADNAEVTTTNEAITISNAAVRVNSTTDYTLGAKLSGSTLTNTGAGTATVNVAEGTTNDFDASSGSVTIDAQTASVGDLTVGDGKTVTIDDGSGTAEVSGTATLANGSTVSGNMTIANSGTLVIGGTDFSENGFGATVEGTLTANATAISLANKIDVTNVTTTTTYVLATAQNMSITGDLTATNFYTGNLAPGMTAAVTVQSMQTATYAIDPATASQLVLTLTEGPVTLTATGVEYFAVEDTHNLRITVAGYDSAALTQFAGRDLAVTIDGEVWKSIIDVMEDHGGIYNTAEIWLDWTALANQDFGTVSFNGYTGTGTPGVYQVSMMPEPTTATLSLLALAALAARRRRK